MATVLLYIHAPTSKIFSERHLPSSITIAQLRGRLEPITGIPPSSQLLTFYNARTDLPDGSPLPAKALDLKGWSAEQEDASTLEQLGIKEGMGLQVGDDRPEDMRGLGDESEVDRYEMTEEEYQKRGDTVLAFKQRHKLGRFDPTAQAAAETSQQTQESQLQALSENLQLGSRCQVEGESQRRGVVRFLGVTDFAKGIWVGVEYDEPVGKGDGSVNDRRYFTCSQRHGGFVKPEKVQVGDFPPIDILDDFDEDEEI